VGGRRHERPLAGGTRAAAGDDARPALPDALLASLDIGDRAVGVDRPLLRGTTRARLQDDGAARHAGTQPIDHQERTLEREYLAGGAAARRGGQLSPGGGAVVRVVEALAGAGVLVLADRHRRLGAAVTASGTCTCIEKRG